MKHFHTLKILDKYYETDDAIVLTLGPAEGDAAVFDYTQGQHLPLRAKVDGKAARRTYSICSSVGDKRLRLGVRVQPDGVFSNYVADHLNIGDTVDAMPPNGHFSTALDAAQEKHYVAFVAGSGITPLYSIVKTTLETEPKSRFTIFYGNRKRATTMFIEELWNLKNLYSERLALHFIMSQEPTDITLYGGRIDGLKAAHLHEAFLKDISVDDIFVCGPNPMIDEVSDVLVGLGYAIDSIHSERFRANKGMAAAAALADRRVQDTEGSTSVTLVIDGNRESMTMNEDESVLDAALRQGVDLPYSCRGGVCSTCRAKLVSGETRMELNYALEPWELEQGFILTCQAKPKSKALEIDYDQT